MRNERLLIDGYLFNDYENTYILNKSKYELINIFYEKISKVNSYIEKFIREKMDNKIMKDKLTEYKNEENFRDLFLLLLSKIDVTFNESYIMLNKILELIKKLKESFKLYFKKYEDFLVNQKKFENKLNEIEIYKNNFINSSNKAETFTYEFLKKKVFNIKSKNQSEFQEKENLKNIAKNEMKKYKEKIKEGNIELKFFNEKQKEAFQAEKKLEIAYNEIYSDCLMTYLEQQLIINGEGTIGEIKQKIVILNEKSNTGQLKYFLDNYIQKEEIDFIQYKSHIEFDNCKDTLELSAVFMTYNEMSEYIGKYKDNVFLDESQKLDLSQKINKILHLNDKITEQDYKILLDVVKNNMGQNVFINLLSLLRSNGFYEKAKNFIIFISKILIFILECAEKEKNYEKAKNCIILSQTFFYLDINRKKIYMFGLIKNNKWIKSPQFWRAFTGISLEKEFEKAHILKKHNLNDVLLTQILPYINNMKELGIDYRIIVKIVDEFLEKYHYLNEESYNTVFALINKNPNQIEKYRKELQDNPNLEKELYNNNDENNENDDNKDNDNKNNYNKDKVGNNDDKGNGNNNIDSNNKVNSQYHNKGNYNKDNYNLENESHNNEDKDSIIKIDENKDNEFIFKEKILNENKNKENKEI